MTREEIDEMFNALYNSDIVTACRIAGMEEIDIDDLADKREEILEKLMLKIEKGDYEYFLEQLKNKYNDAIPMLMVHSSKKEDIKDIIKDRDKYGLALHQVIDLIIATNEPQYIKDCIEKKEEWRFRVHHIIDLIKATNDSQYIKACIEKRDDWGFSSYQVTTLIKTTNDPQYIKECIEKREDLRFSSEQVEDLIKTVNNPQYIKKCIERREELGLDKGLTDLIKATNDPEYIKECIERRKELGLGGGLLLADLIKATNNPEYIKECIERREELKIKYTLTELIIATNDPQYIKDCIEGREELNLYGMTSLIIATDDPQYIKDCIERRNELGFLNLPALIKATNDPQFIKESILKSKGTGIYSDETKKLILETENVMFIKNHIESLGLESSDARDIILATGDLEYIQECKAKGTQIGLYQEDIEKLETFNKGMQIFLPPEMTIGIEIESEGEETNNSDTIKTLLTQINSSWLAKGDGSLQNGTEVVSPILTGDGKKTTDEIRSVCAILNGVGQTTGERCGGHIHIGADYLASKQDWANLIKLWGNSEKVLYILSNKEGEISRSGISTYAPPISKKIEDAIEAGTINLEDEESLEELPSMLSSVQGERYSGINFKNIGSTGKNTIEFRLANGTIDPNTWIENVNLFGGIVRSAHELTVIQEKPEDQRTEEERRKLECFEVILTEQDEDKIAGAIIELCINSEQRQTYINRYSVNKQLLQDSPEINTAVTEGLSINKLGKKVFTGKDAVSGVEYQEGADFIEGQLEAQRQGQQSQENREG